MGMLSFSSEFLYFDKLQINAFLCFRNFPRERSRDTVDHKITWKIQQIFTTKNKAQSTCYCPSGSRRGATGGFGKKMLDLITRSI